MNPAAYVVPLIIGALALSLVAMFFVRRRQLSVPQPNPPANQLEVAMVAMMQDESHGSNITVPLTTGAGVGGGLPTNRVETVAEI